MPRSRDVDPDPSALRRTIERALRRDDPAGDVVPMLERLRQIAQEGSDDCSFADRRLAELLLETAPWRAAIHIRRLLATAPHEHSSWALMALAQALLGHYHFSCTSYRRALALDPGNPWYSHNLGHLLDVALDRPRESLKLLQRAHRCVPDEPAIACSLVHALWRSGDLVAARAALSPLFARGSGIDPDVSALAAELDRSEAEQHRRKPRKKSVRRGSECAPTRTPARLPAQGARPTMHEPYRDLGGGPERMRRLSDVFAALIVRASQPLSLPPARRERALSILADYERAARTEVARPIDRTERALLAGAAALAVARIDGNRRLPYQEVAVKMGVPKLLLRRRLAKMTIALELVVGDPRYRVRR